MLTGLLRQDRSPAALKVGCLPAYAGLWQTRLNPGISHERSQEEAQELRPERTKAPSQLIKPFRQAMLGGHERTVQAAVLGLTRDCPVDLRHRHASEKGCPFKAMRAQAEDNQRQR